MHRACLLLVLFSTAAHCQFTPRPKVALRSGDVTVCRPGVGCDEQVIRGRHFFTMQSEGYLVTIASGADANRSFADVTITNQTGTTQTLHPADFRIEEEGARGGRLSYLDPNQSPPAQAKPPRERKVHDLPAPSYWTSREHLLDRQREQAQNTGAAYTPALESTVLAPDATLSGRVYFERPHTPGSATVLVALPGALFGFPANLIPSGSRTH